MNFNLEKVINHRISILALLMKRHVLKILAEKKLDITPEQWVVMYYLWEENGLSVGEIARRSKKDFANVTRIVEKLQKMGYVFKKKGKEDSRVSNVFILPKADEIKSDIKRCWNEASEAALKGINRADVQHLMKTLILIENNILKNLEGN